MPDTSAVPEENPPTCYICDPLNPDAAEEGCARCDGAFSAFIVDRQRRLNAVTTHKRESTEQGPDFCRPCSEAIGDWVTWPCGGACCNRCGSPVPQSPCRYSDVDCTDRFMAPEVEA